jgi:hypothetical protein
VVINRKVPPAKKKMLSHAYTHARSKSQFVTSCTFEVAVPWRFHLNAVTFKLLKAQTAHPLFVIIVRCAVFRVAGRILGCCRVARQLEGETAACLGHQCLYRNWPVMSLETRKGSHGACAVKAVVVLDLAEVNSLGVELGLPAKGAAHSAKCRMVARWV